MNKQCDKYEAFETGRLAEPLWRIHLSACTLCQQRAKQDQEIMRQARTLRQEPTAPDLWPRIETALVREEKKHLRPQAVTRSRYYGWMRIAAMLALALLAGYWWGTRDAGGSAAFLSENALQRVEKKEQQYEQSIAAMEKLAKPRLSRLDRNLAGLYQERLRTIDEQILRCRAALAENPANAHLRRYLLAAMRDKRETLQRLLEADTV